ncbi:hemerythrin domain-containing protein [Rhodocyclaceae bacterium SMB388]
MSSLEWNDSLELGLEPMDATHREFVECYQALAAADATSFLAAYDRFIEHTVAHFEQENRWMEAVNFPGCHRAEHDRVLAVIRDVRKRVEAGDMFLGRRLVEELPAWFENHAVGMDAALAHYLGQVNFDFATGKVANPAAASGAACAC